MHFLSAHVSDDTKILLTFSKSPVLALAVNVYWAPRAKLLMIFTAPASPKNIISRNASRIFVSLTCTEKSASTFYFLLKFDERLFLNFIIKKAFLEPKIANKA